MTGSAAVTINPLPAAYNVTGGGAYCAGGTGGLSGFLIQKPESTTSFTVTQLLLVHLFQAQVPTISFGNQTVAGTYTVIATNATTS